MIKVAHSEKVIFILEVKKKINSSFHLHLHLNITENFELKWYIHTPLWDHSNYYVQHNLNIQHIVLYTISALLI
jgi:hypothetical protein